mgnify:CR=1 FL=1
MKTAYHELTRDLRDAAQAMFSLSTYDSQWDNILWAMLVTGLPDQPGRPSTVNKNRTYYYPPIRANYAIVAHKAAQDFCLRKGA